MSLDGTAETPRTKDEWRGWARRVRAELDLAALSGAVVDALTAWPALDAASTVLTYLPLPDEIDLTRLMDDRRRWVTTRTPNRGGRLTVHELGGPLELHRFGFPQPHRSAPELDPAAIDLALVPGLAFDLWGARLGRGAGYYDELLTRMSPRLTRVGVVPASLVVDELPTDEHDVPMSFLATDEGAVAPARHGGPPTR